MVPVPETPAKVAALGETLLESIVQAFDDAEVAPPEAQFRWGSIPAIDCEEIVVSLIRIYSGSEADNVSQIGPTIEANLALQVQFDVLVARCVAMMDDDGNPPTAAAQDASGAVIMTDAWIMARGLINRKKQGDFSDCTQITLGQVEALPAEGGFGGNVMTVTVTI